MTDDRHAYFEQTATPLGDLAIAVDDAGRLLAVVFLNDDRKPTIQTWDQTRAALEDAGYLLVEDPEKTAAARAELDEYFAGRRRAFDVEVAPRGTDFQRRIWSLLTKIPCGETWTYAELAAAAGRPRGARAAGRAVATNPIPIVIPCHRVVGADGSLTGFGGGLRFKEGLLALEGASPAPAKKRGSRR